MNEPPELEEEPLEYWYHRVFSSVFSIILYGRYSVSICVESDMGEVDLLFLPNSKLPYFPITMVIKAARASEAETYPMVVKNLETLAEAASEETNGRRSRP